VLPGEVHEEIERKEEERERRKESIKFKVSNINLLKISHAAFARIISRTSFRNYRERSEISLSRKAAERNDDFSFRFFHNLIMSTFYLNLKPTNFAF